MPRTQTPIYLDYAATTPVAPEVISAMRPYWRDIFGNPSSLHSFGTTAKNAVETSRTICAKELNCLPQEIVFTSGGTESVNLALRGYVTGLGRKRQHVITSNIEHPAVAETVAHLKQQGHDVTIIPCNANGMVQVSDVRAAIQEHTTFISIIFAQNEIGTVQPIAEIGKELVRINRVRTTRRLPRIAFHTDACQAPAFLNIDIEKIHVDLLSLDASKMYGPKGIGLLAVKKHVTVTPLFFGGGQEYERRSGTEPVALIVGLAAALQMVGRQRSTQSARLSKLRDWFFEELTTQYPQIRINGDQHHRLPNNINIALPHIEGETIVYLFDAHGIAVSTGSACSTTKPEPSPVITALKLPPAYRRGSLRISMGYSTKPSDLQRVLKLLKKIQT